MKKLKQKKVWEHNGWLSPEGGFVKTWWTGHCETADEIVNERYPASKNSKIVQENPENFLERNGWIKLSASEWYAMGNELTQSQLDFVFDWCVQGNIQFPPKNLK